MKRAFVFLILILMMGVVSSQGQYDKTAAQTKEAQDSLFGSFIKMFALSAFISLFAVGWQFIVGGGIIAFAFLAALQYLGFDIVGWTLEIFRFVFDNVFMLIRWTLANESNLISMIIIFIVLWLIILGFIPGVSLPEPTTIMYKTVSTTTTTLAPWYQFW
jgi:hypothetical protein